MRAYVGGDAGRMRADVDCAQGVGRGRRGRARAASVAGCGRRGGTGATRERGVALTVREREESRMRACSICRRGSPRSRMNRLYKCSVVDIFYRYSAIFDPPRTQTKLQTSTMTQTTNKNGAQLHHDSKMKQVNVSCKYCTRAHLPRPPRLESSRR
jgi:hypothetical protein